REVIRLETRRAWRWISANDLPAIKTGDMTRPHHLDRHRCRLSSIDRDRCSRRSNTDLILAECVRIEQCSGGASPHPRKEHEICVAHPTTSLRGITTTPTLSTAAPRASAHVSFASVGCGPPIAAATQPAGLIEGAAALTGAANRLSTGRRMRDAPAALTKVITSTVGPSCL